MLQYIERGAQLLDQIAATCNVNVNVTALAESLQLPELSEIDVRNTKWISITSSLMNTIRFRFRVAKKSTDTSIQGVEAFDVWDLSKRPFALMKYVGSKLMMHNATADCSSAIDPPTNSMVIEKCTKKNYMDPGLRKWVVLRQAEHIRNEKQVTQVKPAGNLVWNYSPLGNITIESRSIPCPYYVFSLPAGTAFSTSDYDMPSNEVTKSRQTKMMDLC